MIKTLLLTILTMLAAFAMAAPQVETRAQLAKVWLYSDTTCTTPIPGWGYTYLGDSCEGGAYFETGWNSARTENPEVFTWVGGTAGNVITMFGADTCKQGAEEMKEFNATSPDCMTDFGFEANSIGVIGTKGMDPDCLFRHAVDPDFVLQLSSSP